MDSPALEEQTDEIMGLPWFWKTLAFFGSILYFFTPKFVGLIAFALMVLLGIALVLNKLSCDIFGWCQ